MTEPQTAEDRSTDGRVCSKCGVYKPAEQYSKQLVRAKSGPYRILSSRCKNCKAADKRELHIPRSKRCDDVEAVTTPVCYLLVFPDRTFYIGSTANLLRRTQQHKALRGAFQVKILSAHATREEAYKAEFYAIKKYIGYPNCLNVVSAQANSWV